MMKKYLLLDPRYIAYRPAMELPANAELGDSVFTKVAHFVKTVAMRIREGFERRASIKALSELDDRLLRDIGIERYTLEATVDGILKGGHAVAPRPMATVHPLVTPETGKDEETLRPAA